MSRRAILLASAFGAAILTFGVTGGGAHAATAADASQTTTLTDVVITAEKRDETVQTTPIAVSAFTSKERDLIGIDTLNDLTNFTPGLRYSASLDRVFLRGVGRQTNNLATDPGVATYVDGVYDAATYDAEGDELFVSRVEVLRGPQGTLYGRNSIGGDINVVSAMPTSSLYEEGRITIGNYDLYKGEGVISGPLNDNVRFRVGGYFQTQGEGYFKNAANNKSEDGNGNNGYLEAQVAANAGSRFDAWFKVSTLEFDETYRTTNLISPYNTAELSGLGPNTNYAYNPAFAAEGGTFTQIGNVTSNPGVTDPWKYNIAIPNLIHENDDINVIGHLTYHADGFDVKYVGGIAHHNLAIDSGFDNSPVTCYTVPLNPFSTCSFIPGCKPITIDTNVIYHYAEIKTWYSHELDFVSTNDSPLQWLGGLYYYHESYDQPLDISNPSQIQWRTPSGAAANPTGDIFSEDQKMHADSYAAFGQIDWKITPQFKFTGGLRYTYDDKAGEESFRELFMGAGPEYPGGPNYLEDLGTADPVYDITAGAICPTGNSVSCNSGPHTEGVLNTYLDPATGRYHRNLSDNWSAVTGTAGVEWTPTSDLLAYAKYSRGYKSGGFNTGSIAANPTVGPESLDDFEGGVKKTFGGKLTVDASVFYYIYDNMQIELGELNAAGSTSFFLQGVPEVRDYGLELESTWQATDNLQFILSYAYLNTDITKSGCYENTLFPTTASTASCVAAGNPATGFFSVKGNQLIDAPPNKVAINGNYTFHFDAGKLTISASDTWTDAHYSALFNESIYRAPAYNDLDLRLIWNDAKDRYTVILYGKNLLNALEYDYIYPGTSLPIQTSVSLNPPLTFGVQFFFKFQ